MPTSIAASATISSIRKIFPQYRRRSDEAQAALLEWGAEKSRRWLGNMRRLKGWPRVFEAFDGMVASLREKTFVKV